MLIEQDGLCAVCYEKPATSVDHDHKTGQVRGLLCRNCNTGLGMFGDNPELMLAASAYIKGEFNAIGG